MQIGYALTDVTACRLGAAVPEHPDEELIKFIADADKRALHVLWTRHNLRVYRFILRFRQDESMAEDIVSDVFLEVWRGADRFQSKSKVSTWLLAIAHNKAMAAIRRRKHEELDDDDAAAIADLADDPECTLSKKEHGALLQKCLTDLSPAHREVIDLVYYHEKSIAEVAEIVDTSQNTVKTRMFYARKRLAKLLADEGVHSTRS
jgi:RNA polymerase sigma-70 factor, ECF subfamily